MDQTEVHGPRGWQLEGRFTTGYWQGRLASVDTSSGDDQAWTEDWVKDGKRGEQMTGGTDVGPE